MNSVVVRAPTRLDFGGGWTDVPPYTSEAGGRVCNVAINRYAEVTVAARRDAESDISLAADGALVNAAMKRNGVTGVRTSVRSDFPTGAGLGGSSAVGVALCAALRLWRGLPIDDRFALAKESREVEVSEAGIAGGWQDHFAAAFGGALDLTFTIDTHVRQLAITHETRSELERRCLVFYTGQSRISGDTITAVLTAYRLREPAVVQALAAMKELAVAMPAALESGDLDRLGELIGAHWRHQRSLHTSISTPRIEEVLHAATRAGALGGKALGASGGGCVAVIARRGAEAAISAAVSPLARALPFHLDVAGVQVVSVDGVRRDA